MHPWERVTSACWRKYTDPENRSRLSHILEVETSYRKLDSLNGNHRALAIRAASYQIVKPSVLVSRIQKIKTFRGHPNAVYCAIFDKSGEYIITGSDDRLVKFGPQQQDSAYAAAEAMKGTLLTLQSGEEMAKKGTYQARRPDVPPKGPTPTRTEFQENPNHVAEDSMKAGD